MIIFRMHRNKAEIIRDGRNPRSRKSCKLRASWVSGLFVCLVEVVLTRDRHRRLSFANAGRQISILDFTLSRTSDVACPTFSEGYPEPSIDCAWIIDRWPGNWKEEKKKTAAHSNVKRTSNRWYSFIRYLVYTALIYLWIATMLDLTSEQNRRYSSGLIMLISIFKEIKF